MVNSECLVVDESEILRNWPYPEDIVRTVVGFVFACGKALSDESGSSAVAEAGVVGEVRLLTDGDDGLDIAGESLALRAPVLEEGGRGNAPILMSDDDGDKIGEEANALVGSDAKRAEEVCVFSVGNDDGVSERVVLIERDGLDGVESPLSSDLRELGAGETVGPSCLRVFVTGNAGKGISGGAIVGEECQMRS